MHFNLQTLMEYDFKIVRVQFSSGIKNPPIFQFQLGLKIRTRILYLNDILSVHSKLDTFLY